MADLVVSPLALRDLVGLVIGRISGRRLRIEDVEAETMTCSSNYNIWQSKASERQMMTNSWGDIPAHYAFVIRMLLTLYNGGQLPSVESITVEPEFGYVARIVYANGGVRMVKGGNVGLNSAASSEVTKDKGYTRFFLQDGGFMCPRGESFLLPWWMSELTTSGRNATMPLRGSSKIPAFVEELGGFPIWMKPVDGSRGKGVTRCLQADDVDRTVALYDRERVAIAVIEEEVKYPDFRLVVLDGRVISTYSRQPLHIVGDGIKSAEILLEDLSERFEESGRAGISHYKYDAIVNRNLRNQGLRWQDVPARGRVVRLQDVSNLSAGGISADLTSEAHERWRQIAVDATSFLGLRYAGVDLACPDIRRFSDDYRILEINAAPGLDHFARTGEAQEELVANLYREIFDASPLL